MELKLIRKLEPRTKVISIRTFQSYSDWMKANRVSPSRVFNRALKEVMKKEREKHK